MRSLKASSARQLTTVVRGSEGAEAFLAGGVPNLELDHLVAMFDRLEFKVDSDRIEEVFIE